MASHTASFRTPSGAPAQHRGSHALPVPLKTLHNACAQVLQRSCGEGIRNSKIQNKSLERETCRDFLYWLLPPGLSSRQGEEKKAETCNLKLLLRINCSDWHSWVRLNERKVKYKVMLLVPHGIIARLHFHTHVWPQYINFSNSAAHNRSFFRKY